jgi:hypothetical protein
MERKTIGSILGALGGQIFAFGLFGLLSEPCQDLLGQPQQCFAGLTFWAYWARYGTGLSVTFLVVGYVIGKGWE